jgi:hypothetical protein
MNDDDNIDLDEDDEGLDIDLHDIWDSNAIITGGGHAFEITDDYAGQVDYSDDYAGQVGYSDMNVYKCYRCGTIIGLPKFYGEIFDTERQGYATCDEMIVTDVMGE